MQHVAIYGINFSLLIVITLYSYSYSYFEKGQQKMLILVKEN